MNPESETTRIKSLLTSALYFDAYHRHQMAISKPKPSRKAPKTKKTMANRAKNKRARGDRKKNRN